MNEIFQLMYDYDSFLFPGKNAELMATVKIAEEKYSIITVNNNNDNDSMMLSDKIKLAICYVYHGRLQRVMDLYVVKKETAKLFRIAENLALECIKSLSETPNLTVVERNELTAYAHWVVGEANRLLESNKNAMEHASIAISLLPSLYNAYYTRGDTKRMIGDYRGAIADNTTAITLRSDHCYSFYSRGDAYRMTGNYNNCIDDSTEALRIDPTLANALHCRADSYRIMSSSDFSYMKLAIQDAQRVIEIEPDHYSAHYTLAACYYQAGQYQQSADEASEAIKRSPENHLAYVTRGAAYAKLKRLDLAAEDLLIGLAIEPNYNWARRVFESIQILNEDDDDDVLVDEGDE